MSEIELTTKTARRLEEIDKEIRVLKLTAKLDGSELFEIKELKGEKQGIINEKNELKEIMSNAKLNDIQILIQIHTLIKEIESVENADNKTAD